VTFRSLASICTCLVGLAVTAASLGQAPPAESTHDDMEWGEYLAKNPEVMGVHLAGMKKTIEELQSRIEALERRKPPPMNAATLPFSIRDAKGKVRFLMDAGGDDNGAVMVIMNSKGLPGVGLSALEDGGSVEVTDESGARVASLRSLLNGGILRVSHQDGRSVEVDGGAGVKVQGSDDNAHVQLYSDGKSGQVNVYGGSGGHAVAQMRTISSGAGRLTLTNGDGSILLDAGATPSGVGLLKLGPDGNGAAGTIGNNGRAASSLQGKK
jgi:hypothetical protein